ncbi:MAG TPA: hypothetical protein VEJ84_23555 [Acidimicrobiales bacterium]|nr:hypothetical protein [Acidimicrobiales bacterium]
MDWSGFYLLAIAAAFYPAFLAIVALLLPPSFRPAVCGAARRWVHGHNIERALDRFGGGEHCCTQRSQQAHRKPGDDIGLGVILLASVPLI